MRTEESPGKDREEATVSCGSRVERVNAAKGAPELDAFYAIRKRDNH